MYLLPLSIKRNHPKWMITLPLFLSRFYCSTSTLTSSFFKRFPWFLWVFFKSPPFRWTETLVVLVTGNPVSPSTIWVLLCREGVYKINVSNKQYFSIQGLTDDKIIMNKRPVTYTWNTDSLKVKFTKSI